MQPRKRPGKLVHVSATKLDWFEEVWFTGHLLDRMEQRGVSSADVIQTLFAGKDSSRNY